MLSPQQVAERMGVSDDTVIGWIKDRQLRGTLISKSLRSLKPRFRVAAADLETFIAARTVGPAPARPKSPRRQAYERIV